MSEQAHTEQLPMPIPAPLTRAQRRQVINIVRRAARAEILPRFRNLGAGEIGQKSGPQDLVTDADREAEKMIARGLLSMFPNATILGEESSGSDPDRIAEMAKADMAFIIDPVDGTWNFANGLATFGVILCMTRFGVPVFGLLYDPVMDDVILADEASPAELIAPRRSARPIRVSKGGEIGDLYGYVPLYLLPRDKQDRMAALMPRFQRLLSLRCSAHEFRMVAQGNVDFMLSAKLTPWDQAAGALIVKQAGGHVALLDGSEYRADTRDGYLLSACNRQTWERVRDEMAFLLDEEA